MLPVLGYEGGVLFWFGGFPHQASPQPIVDDRRGHLKSAQIAFTARVGATTVIEVLFDQADMFLGAIAPAGKVSRVEPGGIEQQDVRRFEHQEKHVEVFALDRDHATILQFMDTHNFFDVTVFVQPAIGAALRHEMQPQQVRYLLREFDVGAVVTVAVELTDEQQLFTKLKRPRSATAQRRFDPHLPLRCAFPVAVT